jgi:hypothetical protein
MKLSIAILSAALLVGSAALAQEKKPHSSLPSETQQDTTKSTPAGTKKMSTVSVIGKVTDFTEGKSITVEKPKGLKKTRTFNLNGDNLTADVAAGVAVGNTVKVVEKTDHNGHKTVTVQPYGKGSRARAKS